MSTQEPGDTATLEERPDAAQVAAKAEFDAGFTTEGTATATPQPKAEVDAGDEVQEGTKETAAPAAPEFVQLTKADFERINAAAALVEQHRATAEKSFGTAFGKIGGIERDLQALRVGRKVQIPPETITLLRGEIPELADALEQINGLAAIGASGVDESRVEALVQERVSASEKKLEQRLLARDHPDWETVTKTPEFNQYAASLPGLELERLANSWDADFISEHLTRFKKAQAARTAPPPPSPAPAPSRRSRMQAAVTTGGTGAPAPGPSDEDEFDAGFKSG